MATILFIKFFPLMLITLGLLPSVVWLLIYLREDVHPEPKKLILRIFGWGMLVAPLALLVQYLLLSLVGLADIAAPVRALVSLLSLAVVEEYLKYLVVRVEIEDEPDFDEPTDAMTYLIVSALGFAAVENVLIAFSLTSSAPAGSAILMATESAKFLDAVRVLGVRFFGATLLHAFSSAIVGYCMARQLLLQRGAHHADPSMWHAAHKGRLWIIAAGLGIASTLHAIFNYLILQSSEVRSAVVLPISVGMVLVILWLFKRLRRPVEMAGAR